MGLRTERAGVLSLVMSLILGLMVNSMVAIRDFLIAELIALRIVKLLLLSGSDVRFLSMRIVWSRFVKREGRDFLFCEEVEGGAEDALEAFSTQVTVRKGIIGLCCAGVGVVIAGAGVP